MRRAGFSATTVIPSIVTDNADDLRAGARLDKGRNDTDLAMLAVNHAILGKRRRIPLVDHEWLVR